MAGPQHQPLDEFRHLRIQAAQTRLRAIQSQVALGLTFCSVAELELKIGHSERIRKVIENLQRLSATVRRHLDEPDHVPSDAVEGVRTELVRLESRILALDEHERRQRR